jgi:anthranilate phosphoribosyltransferase
MKNILNRLINHEMLTQQKQKILVNISNGSYNPSQISAFDRLHDAQHQH